MSAKAVQWMKGQEEYAVACYWAKQIKHGGTIKETNVIVTLPWAAYLSSAAVMDGYEAMMLGGSVTVDEQAVARFRVAVGTDEANIGTSDDPKQYLASLGLEPIEVVEF
jgi:hypothetical protein